MNTELITAIRERRGCLSHLRTQRGRRRFDTSLDDPFYMEDDFVSDEAKILLSKTYRLLGKKTQVLTLSSIPFLRNRIIHVGEVVGISVVIAEILGLNISLVRSIALGHDLGHVPYGHPGEAHMAKRMRLPEFCHEVMGPIVLQKIERKGKGLNLTFETLDGMMRHSGNTEREDMTQEAWVVRFADKFAYIFADYSDLVQRMVFPVSHELVSAMAEFGRDHRTRTSTAIAGLIIESAEKGKVSFKHSDLAHKFNHLRDLMMKLYVRATEQDMTPILDPVIEYLGKLEIGNPYLLLALMTDEDVAFLNSNRSKNVTLLQHTALRERLPYIEDLGDIDLCNPDLDW
ncbi:HD domain-containing protein [Candidatus Parcubacteria bacterium]|nr:HD domain-containing protein [Candidatus Parcubacteria bacterium]